MISYCPQESGGKGKEIRDAHVAAIPGLSDLLDAIKSAGDRGYIKAIDGRKIILDSPHKALNYLLQGSAGVIAKRWLVLAHDNPYCCSQLAFVHDELQYECDPSTLRYFSPIWSLRLQKPVPITTSESSLPLKAKSETTGQKYTND